MSYSRWLNSEWYTYWDVANGHIKKKNSQLFTICSDRSFSYAELKEDINKCLSLVNSRAESDMEELKEYMERFIDDVELDNEFK